MKRLREVIRHEGDKWILYSHDGKKKLGEFTSEEAARKRERQIQFFKHRESARDLVESLRNLVEKKHSTAWHDCWEKVKGEYDDRAAAAICTWSIQRAPNPPDVYEAARGVREAKVTLTIDEINDVDEVLGAEMELRGVASLVIDTDTWDVVEVLLDGSQANPVEPVAAELYTPQIESARAALAQRGLLEVGARHTKREFEIIKQVIALMTELYGEIDDLSKLLQDTQESLGYPTVVDYLISCVHRTFTIEADDLFGNGRLSQDERTFLSHCIGQALDAFNATIDAEMPVLRDRGLRDPYYEPAPATVIVADNVTTDAPVVASLRDSRLLESEAGSTSRIERDLKESFDGMPTILEAKHPDGSYILNGIVIIEGKSANGFVYTRESLPTAISHFTGKPIFIDHPTLTESRERPERSELDRVGRLPLEPENFYVAEVKKGPHAGKHALHYKSGKLSSTADWLATKIREGISGDQSINARGRGREEGDAFFVEAFIDGFSLDFVTTGAAGGRGGLPLAEAARHKEAPSDSHPSTSPTQPNAQEAHAMAQKVDGSKSTIARLQEALRLRQRRERFLARKQQADQIVTEAVKSLPDEAQKRIRTLFESAVCRFVEADGEQPGALPIGAGLAAGDPPTIELPPDVAELPAEAQALWIQSYTSNLGKGEDKALHIAWADVYSAGWTQDDGGAWKKEQQGSDALGAPAPDMAPYTTESFKAAIAKIAADEKAYLSKVTEAGRVTGLGNSNDPEAGPASEQTETKLQEAFAGLLGDEQQGKVAARGRAV
ncbi:MAG TPA: hypothetical protein VJG32_17945 [Anaerolineae bacterium]|nr:hypothetical protein [Anaerolineae bacterium]